MHSTRLLPRLAATLALATAFAAFAQPAAPPLRTTVLAEGLDNPWSLAFLPDFEKTGRMLVTEKPGTMRIVGTDGKLSAPLKGVPPVVARGQGGLLDVTLHPDFKDNQLVYWSFSEAAPSGSGNSTAVARGRLDAAAGALRDVKVVFRQVPKVASNMHFGSRLVFDRDGRLFITLGDRGSRRNDAQTLDNHHGKIVRITDDGGVPPDNPFVGTAGALPEIWSYGHRNVQGAALHPATSALWADEHGPQGGDELNIPQKGQNHGWPVITYGREYGTGTKIGEGTAREGIVAPITRWVPSIAPSGLAFVTSDRHAAWKGQALVGSLKFGQLVRLELDGDKVAREHRHDAGARVRDVRQGPDGHLYLLTDDGELLRIEPGS
ncbi:MAG: PQQ-dependent sugar dehydrogenase [Methylibium sp.]|uniref:PQQ-dependent sugar dehydrogenase n=1 Tax=Methylibium sp. TaxID=2067992 RepID=UPI0017A68F87|nr:PQQ-dependent sugar dehydrogenase [Methylibium sp.]MBA3596589.1 PQQ-dependent sugar dehydrogenase [Methylibium sp.]